MRKVFCIGHGHWRKITCLSAFLLTLTLSANDTLNISLPSSKRWVVSASVGYGWSATKDILGSQMINDGQNNLSQNQIRGTFGKGVLNSLSICYNLRRHVNTEVGFFSNWGQEIQTRDWATPTSNQYQDIFFKVNTKGFLIGICLADTFSKILVSIHNDLVWGINNRGFEREIVSYPNSVFIQQWEYHGGMSLGWSGKISVKYGLGNHFRVGLDGFVMLHSWSPDKRDMVSYTLNDQDQLSTVPEENKHTTFSNSINYSSTSGFPPGQAFKVLYPLHATGVMVTAAYSF